MNDKRSSSAEICGVRVGLLMCLQDCKSRFVQEIAAMQQFEDKRAERTINTILPCACVQMFSRTCHFFKWIVLPFVEGSAGESYFEK